MIGLQLFFFKFQLVLPGFSFSAMGARSSVHATANPEFSKNFVQFGEIKSVSWHIPRCATENCCTLDWGENENAKHSYNIDNN